MALACLGEVVRRQVHDTDVAAQDAAGLHVDIDDVQTGVVLLQARGATARATQGPAQQQAIDGVMTDQQQALPVGLGQDLLEAGHDAAVEIAPALAADKSAVRLGETVKGVADLPLHLFRRNLAQAAGTHFP
ncbi:hypothetical protein D3C87_1330540 [compost metagenome]